MEDLQEQLTRLKSMLEEGLITEEEYDTLKNQFFSEALDKKESDEEMEESISLSDQLIPEVDSSESEENVDNDSFSDGQQKSVEVLYPKEQIDTVSQTDTNTFVETREAKEDKKVKKILLWFGIFLASYLLVVALPKIADENMSNEKIAIKIINNSEFWNTADSVNGQTKKNVINDIKSDNPDLGNAALLEAIELLEKNNVKKSDLKNYEQYVDIDESKIISNQFITSNIYEKDNESGNKKATTLVNDSGYKVIIFDEEDDKIDTKTVFN